ncbi:MAG: hypothetical protein HZA49_05765 [Planctomycetes bacterium]|nr:hypothetical protein [Planctomycetota bacterium]
MNRGLWMKLGLVAVLIAVIVIGYNGCGGSSSSSGSSSVAKLTLSGKIGTSYIVAAAPSNILDRFCTIFQPQKAWAAYSDGTVDKVIAMPYDSGYLGEYCLQGIKEAVINVDGTFNLSLEKDRNWLLILVDSSVTGREKFVGYVALKMNTTDSMLLAPVSSATASSLDLGTIEQSITDSDVALTENTVTTTAFSLSQSQLLDLAKNDDLLKIVKNLYFNYQGGVYWNLRPDYNWSGDYSAISGTGFPNPSTFTFSGGYNFQLDSNFMGITVQQFIGPPTGTPKALLELYPPASVEAKDSGFIYDTSTPISNLNNTTGGPTVGGEWEAWANDFFAGERYGNISYSTGSLTGTIPVGFWKFGVTNTGTSTLLSSAEFDVAVASPISGTVIKGFVPSIKVNVDGSKRITSVDVKWYAWDGAAYVEVTDTSALKSLVGSFDFMFDNTTGGTRRYESSGHDVSVASVVPQGIPAGTPWYYGNFGEVTEAQRAEMIGVFYSCGGIGYFFFWNNWQW